MHVVVYCYLVAALLPTPFSANASTITSAPKPTSTESLDVPKTCEFRTINYITDSLPQLCLKSSWSFANGTSVKASNGTATGDGHAGEGITSSISEAASLSQDGMSSAANRETASIESTPSSAVEPADAAATDLETGELSEASFLSFEEWKKQTLDKAGQAHANIGTKKPGEGKKRDSESIQNNLDSLGDDGEIDLDFGAFRSGGKGEEAAQTTENIGAEAGQDPQDVEKRTKDQHRNKDAGKTCKERFSYASFDAGATVLKTHPGAKNAKSVLIENKDSYMLSECSAENKFIIIELSEDIWIDTLVLANYEFFSSMIRTFRVSVSDKYPVKIEKWKDIGTYEARNSREIQAFLIENPQIWARYLRIEFLSHYGNEYYCPLSLVRVHGARMLESWKETEAGSDDDTDETEGGEEQFVPDAVAEVLQEEERLNAELKAQSTTTQPEPSALDVSQSVETPSMEQMITPWEKSGGFTFDLPESSSPNHVCLPSEAPTETSTLVEVTNVENSHIPESTQASIPSPTTTTSYTNPTELTTTSQVTHPGKTSATESTSIKESSSAVASALNSTNSASDILTPSLSPTAIASKSHNITNSVKNKTTSTSSAATSLPTIQESFFKAVSRRLQLLETNSTLSLKYIEEQSKILREAFTKVEKKQLQKTTTFLDTLNSTVLNELRGFRQQYDEIWQSTVISLESQRDESRREILAISTRLNILADEVVFQKRMSIVQSILLLLCLGLVIFSRVSGGGNIDFPTFHSRGHSRSRQLTTYTSQLEGPLDGSVPASPNFHEADDSGHWLETGHRRQLSDDTAVSRSRSRDESPPTPISTYSRSDEHALTPPSGADDLNIASTRDLLPEPIESIEEFLPNPSKASSSSYLTTSENAAASPIRTPKKRKGFIRQQQSPPASSAEADDSFNSSLPSSTPQHEPIAHEEQHTTPHTDLAPITDPSRLPSPPTEPVDPEPEPSSTQSPRPPQKSPSHNYNLSPRFSIARKPLPALPPDGS